jgi:hypothetical protein
MTMIKEIPENCKIGRNLQIRLATPSDSSWSSVLDLLALIIAMNHPDIGFAFKN